MKGQAITTVTLQLKKDITTTVDYVLSIHASSDCSDSGYCTVPQLLLLYSSFQCLHFKYLGHGTQRAKSGHGYIKFWGHANESLH